jgi:mandelate racemase
VIATRLDIRAVDVPMRRPLGTSAQTVRSAPLLLIDLHTDAGVVGHAYLFCYLTAGQRLMADALRDAAELVQGQPVDPRAVGAVLARRWRLFGSPGAVGMALAGIDVALWDALAQEAGVPLVRLLGGQPIPLPCYNSNGLGLIDAPQAAREALELIDEGYSQIKLRLGYPNLADDLAAVRAVRDAIGPQAGLLVDYNQLLDRDEGLRRCSALDGLGLEWIEEPIMHDDYAGSAAIAARIETPVQIGENLSGANAVEAALTARASDLLMFDLQRIGGVTGWLAATARAAGYSPTPLSSHLFPEVSAHLLAVTPNHDRLEMVDWAAPILREPLCVTDGTAIASDRPGTGVAWDEDAVRHLAC